MTGNANTTNIVNNNIVVTSNSSFKKSLDREDTESSIYLDKDIKDPNNKDIIPHKESVNSMKDINTSLGYILNSTNNSPSKSKQISNFSSTTNNTNAINNNNTNNTNSNNTNSNNSNSNSNNNINNNNLNIKEV